MAPMAVSEAISNGPSTLLYFCSIKKKKRKENKTKAETKYKEKEKEKERGKKYQKVRNWISFEINNGVAKDGNSLEQ